MTEEPKSQKTMKKNRILLFLLAFFVYLITVLLFIPQNIVLTFGLPYNLGSFLVAIELSLFATVTCYFIYKVMFKKRKEYAWMERPRTWLFLWALGAATVGAYPLFALLYDFLVPTIDREIRQEILPPLTVLLIWIMISTPPLRSRTKRLFEKALGFKY